MKLYHNRQTLTESVLGMEEVEVAEIHFESLMF